MVIKHWNRHSEWFWDLHPWRCEGAEYHGLVSDLAWAGVGPSRPKSFRHSVLWSHINMCVWFFVTLVLFLSPPFLDILLNDFYIIIWTRITCIKSRLYLDGLVSSADRSFYTAILILDKTSEKSLILISNHCVYSHFSHKLVYSCFYPLYFSYFKVFSVTVVKTYFHSET